MKISTTTVCIILFVLVIFFCCGVFMYIPSENRPYICGFFILLAILNSVFTSAYQRNYANDVASGAKEVGFDIPPVTPYIEPSDNSVLQMPNDNSALPMPPELLEE